jgi:UDPglucose 6-dehydrogenase
MSKIAIVGYGFVGKAVEAGFQNSQNEILIVDPAKGFADIESLDDYGPDYTFVCVPTPMGEDGSIDDTIISSVIGKLHSAPTGVVIVKSTVTPDIIDRICKYKRFVYSPEFLTERNAIDEFLNPKFHLFGGRPEFTKKVKNLYVFGSNCTPAPFYYMTVKEASFVKYGINSFLAMKVVWFNQWKEMVEASGARYNIVANAMGSDPRIGHSHTKVPGLDGKKGFGGSCFPKDTAAIHNYCPDLTVLKAVIDANNIYRSEYDLDAREIEQKIKFK